MAGSPSSQPIRPNPPAAKAPKKPLQVMHISRREGQKDLEKDSILTNDADKSALGKGQIENKTSIKPRYLQANSGSTTEGFEDLGNISMADLIGPANQSNKKESSPKASAFGENQWNESSARLVDDFDFDEDQFLAALDENQPIGNTGEIATGSVINIDSDGVYVDIGGKAPGFMPKNECGLGAITNLKERFPKGLEVEVLVTREQNADGMVTISCRALALRKSWEKVREMEKEGRVAQVKVNGFNRGGVTCDLEGLRGFIPRSQLENGENHESLVGKTLGVAFLEVNPDARKLVLSEKRATIAARFSELEVGQLVEGKVASIKPYGFFIELGGVSGLLHQSMITNGSLRSLREVFDLGDPIKALITELDPGRGRIGLNTALLEAQPGELLVEKEKVMEEAVERAQKARNALKKPEQPED